MKPALAVVALVFAGACARTTGPVVIPSEDLPFPLSRTIEERHPNVPQSVSIALVRRGRLVTVARRLATPGGSAEAVLTALLRGPTAAERRRGLQSAIPPTTQLLGVGVVGTVGIVDLSAEFQEPAPSDVILLRVAQVVFSLVRLRDVTAVRFSIEGQPVSVVTQSGASVERPVSTPDYSNVAPAPRRRTVTEP